MMDELDCFRNMTAPARMFTCINASNNDMTTQILFMGVFALILFGASMILGIERGMALSGFFGLLIGLGFFWLGWISIATLFMPLIVMFIGIVLLIIQQQSN